MISSGTVKWKSLVQGRGQPQCEMTAVFGLEYMHQGITQANEDKEINVFDNS